MEDPAPQEPEAEPPAPPVDAGRSLGVGGEASGHRLEQVGCGEADEDRLGRGQPSVAGPGGVGAHHPERRREGHDEPADEGGSAGGEGESLAVPRRPGLDVGVDAGFDQQPGGPDGADMGEAVPAGVDLLDMLDEMPVPGPMGRRRRGVGGGCGWSGGGGLGMGGGGEGYEEKEEAGWAG